MATRWKRGRRYEIVHMHAHNRWSQWYSALMGAANEMGLMVGEWWGRNHHDGSIDRSWYTSADLLDSKGGPTALQRRAREIHQTVMGYDPFCRICRRDGGSLCPRCERTACHACRGFGCAECDGNGVEPIMTTEGRHGLRVEYETLACKVTAYMGGEVLISKTYDDGESAWSAYQEAIEGMSQALAWHECFAGV